MYPDYHATITSKDGKKYFSYDEPINLLNKQRKSEIIELYDKHFRLLDINPNYIFKITKFSFENDVQGGQIND